MSGPIRVHMSVTTDDPELIARTVEHFSRTAAGLALEGGTCFVSIGPDRPGGRGVSFSIPS